MNLKTIYSNREKNRKNDTNVVLVCKECNGVFTTTVGHLCWHYDVGNLIPLYCEKCKEKRKEDRINNRKKRMSDKIENPSVVTDTIEDTQEEKLIEEN